MENPAANVLTIATRESPLALWQAEHVRGILQQAWPELQVELLGMTTRGDQMLDSPLAKVGGKGLFVKELEVAMLEKRADIAVHSAKDMPMQLPGGLSLMIACPRAEPLDALVLPKSADNTENSTIQSIHDLPPGAVVGTSSLRRQCQLLHARPDIRYRDLRGNVNTRLRKLDEGQYDAIILAAAGLQRLGLAERISAKLPPDLFLPAVGQGALAIEYRSDDSELLARLAPLSDRDTQLRITAERAMNRRLEGGCQVPVAGFAQLQTDLQSRQLSLEGRVGAVDGSQLLTATQSVVLGAADAMTAADALGVAVAEQLLEQGAQQLLDAAYSDDS